MMGGVVPEPVEDTTHAVMELVPALHSEITRSPRWAALYPQGRANAVLMLSAELAAWAIFEYGADVEVAAEMWRWTVDYLLECQKGGDSR